jgi:phosphoribosylanthranilate isomerase
MARLASSARRRFESRPSSVQISRNMPTTVKICGLTDEASLDAACAAGADYVGLVFYGRSPRNLDVSRARVLRGRVPRDGRCRVVALIVDADDGLIETIVREVDPDILQLHGHETPERVAAIRARFGRPIIKAVAVARPEEATAALAYLDPGRLADIVLFDAKPDSRAVLPGGNGLTFDWHILEPVRDGPPFALAGGLTPDNVAEAIARTGAAIVDVSSGVETAPGRKDPGLIRRFLRNAKGAKQRAHGVARES